jgi:hypothetical protein
MLTGIAGTVFPPGLAAAAQQMAGQLLDALNPAG